MIQNKIKCVHCNREIIMNPTGITPIKCDCGKVSLINGVIVEGVHGVDWIDISPQLLNE